MGFFELRITKSYDSAPWTNQCDIDFKEICKKFDGYGESSLCEYQDSLFNFMHKKGVEPSILSTNWWKDIIILSSKDYDYTDDRYLSALKEISNLVIKEKETTSIRFIVSMLMRIGLLSMAGNLRAALLDYYKYMGVGKSYVSCDNMRLLYAARFEDDGYIVGKHKSLFNILCKRYARSFSVAKSVLDKSQSYDNKILKRDIEFAKYIYNKNVAIVGPAVVDTEDGLEIDSYDVVVRFNHKKPIHESDRVFKGGRCDVVYFNGSQTNSFLASNPDDFPVSDVSFFVTKSDRKSLKAKKFFDIKYSGNEIECRASRNADDLFINGTLNAVPQAVFDILGFKPASVKIFHVDFMLTVNRTKDYYPGSWERESVMKESFLKSVSISHDPLTQYKFMNLLYEKDMYIPDSKLRSALELGEVEFMKVLENTYRDAGLLYGKFIN